MQNLSEENSHEFNSDDELIEEIDYAWSLVLKKAELLEEKRVLELEIN